MLSMILLAVLADASAGPLPSHEVGAGGPILHPAWLPEVGPLDRTPRYSPGLLQCVGGQGFGTDGPLRLGGEGHFCGNAEAMVGYGGAQVGVMRHPGPFLASAYATVGGGWLGVGPSEEPDYASTFLFVRPTLSGGVGFGWFGMELGVFSTLALPVAQWEGDDSVVGPGFGFSGAQIAFLFGDFWPHSSQTHHPRPRPPATGDAEIDAALQEAQLHMEEAARELERAAAAAGDGAREPLSEAGRQAVQGVGTALQAAGLALESVGQQMQTPEPEDAAEPPAALPAQEAAEPEPASGE